MKIPSKGEETLALHLRAEGIPFEREVQQIPGRKFLFDFCIDHAFMVEVEGVTHAGGRHQRIDGYTRDCEKYNLAQSLGWRVYRFTQQQIYSGEAIEFIKQELQP